MRELEKYFLGPMWANYNLARALSFKSRIKPEKSVWMEDAKLKNLVVCQPENRNRFNKIFGGFIMR